MSAGMSGTRGSGVLSSTGDVLEMSVVRGVGGVCDMCMCLARGGVGVERIGFGLHQSCGDRGSVGHVCVLVAVVYVGSRYGAWARVGSGEVVLCLCEV